MAEVVPVARVGNDLGPGLVDLLAGDSGPGNGDARQLGLEHRVVPVQQKDGGELELLSLVSAVDQAGGPGLADLLQHPQVRHLLHGQGGRHMVAAVQGLLGVAHDLEGEVVGADLLPDARRIALEHHQRPAPRRLDLAVLLLQPE